MAVNIVNVYCKYLLAVMLMSDLLDHRHRGFNIRKGDAVQYILLNRLS